jgi:hypothetical protein
MKILEYELFKNKNPMIWFDSETKTLWYELFKNKNFVI